MAGFISGSIVPKRITAFTAHISIAYDPPGFSSFGHDPCLRIMTVLYIIGEDEGKFLGGDFVPCKTSFSLCSSRFKGQYLCSIL
jgi:hypothetical protein